jgi:hypothetical protein
LPPHPTFQLGLFATIVGAQALNVHQKTYLPMLALDSFSGKSLLERQLEKAARNYQHNEHQEGAR